MSCEERAVKGAFCFEVKYLHVMSDQNAVICDSVLDDEQMTPVPIFLTCEARRGI
jgi:hypothetical protein